MSPSVSNNSGIQINASWMQVQRECLWTTCFRICYPSPQQWWLPATDKGLGHEPGFLIGLHVDLVYWASQALALRQWQALYLSPCLCSSPSFSITCSSSTSTALCLLLPLINFIILAKKIHAVTTGHCSHRHLWDLWHRCKALFCQDKK